MAKCAWCGREYKMTRSATGWPNKYCCTKCEKEAEKNK